MSQGTDSARYYFYDKAGNLAAVNDVGLGGAGCISYDPSFMLPASCDITTPDCDDAGSD